LSAAEDGRVSGSARILLLWGGGCILGLMIYGALFQSPLDRRAVVLARERPPLEKMVRELEITVAKYEEFARERAALEDKLVILRGMLPAALDTDEVRRVLGRCAVSRNVELVAVSSGKPETLKDGEIAMPFTATVRGRLPAVAAFFGRMDRLALTMHTRDVVIQREGTTYRGRGTVATFVYARPTPRPRPGRI
jgi:hypothetical protein